MKYRGKQESHKYTVEAETSAKTETGTERQCRQGKGQRARQKQPNED